MIGKCEDCGTELDVRHQRGVRLVHIPCPECGGRLRGKGVGQRRGPRTFGKCVICGRRRETRNLVTLATDSVFPYNKEFCDRGYVSKTAKAGQTVCTLHESSQITITA